MVQFEEVAASLGLDVTLIPGGTMGLADAVDYRGIAPDNGKLQSFARDPLNGTCILYGVETEHDPHVGCILRNLHRGHERARHMMVLERPDAAAPFFHNFTAALPRAWADGCIVACEGAKDARVLHQLGLPAVAYLGAAPSADWLRVIRRYVSLLVLIPDNDATYNEKALWVRRQRLRTAEALGLLVREIRTATKDPGDLVGDPGEAARVQRAYQMIVSLHRKP